MKLYHQVSEFRLSLAVYGLLLLVAPFFCPMQNVAIFAGNLVSAYLLSRYFVKKDRNSAKEGHTTSEFYAVVSLLVYLAGTMLLRRLSPSWGFGIGSAVTALYTLTRGAIKMLPLPRNSNMLVMR